MEGLPLPYKEDEDVEFADLSAATTNYNELHNGLDDAGDGDIVDDGEGDGGGPVVVDEEEVERGMKEFEEKLKLSSFSRKRELEKQKRLSLMMAKYSSLSPSSSASGTPGSPTSAARAASLLSGSSASPFASSSLTPHGASSSLSSPMTSASPLHASSPFYEEETGERRRELEELRIRLAAKDTEIKRLIREKQEERRKAEEKEKTRREVEEKWQESIAEIELLKSSLESQQIILKDLQEKEEERKEREAETEAEKAYFHQELEQKLREKAEDLEEELIFREEEVKKMEEQLTQLDEEREREKGLAAKLKAKLADLTKELAARDKEFKEFKAAKQDARDKESTEKDKRMQELEARVKKMQKERELYKKMKADAAQRDRELKEVMAATQTLKEGLGQAKQELEARADDERQRLDELEALRRTLAERESEAEALRAWKAQREAEAEAEARARAEAEERERLAWEAKLAAALAEEQSARERDTAELRRQLDAALAQQQQDKQKEDEKEKEKEMEREKQRQQQKADEEAAAAAQRIHSASIASMMGSSVTRELVTAAREELDMVHYLTAEVEAMIHKNEAEAVAADEGTYAVWNARKSEALAAINDLKQWSEKVAKYAEEATQKPKDIVLQERLMGSQKQMGKRFEKMIALSLPLSPSPTRQEQLRTALETLTALHKDQDEEDGSESLLGGSDSLNSSSSSVSLSSSLSELPAVAPTTKPPPQQEEAAKNIETTPAAAAAAAVPSPAVEVAVNGAPAEASQPSPRQGADQSAKATTEKSENEASPQVVEQKVAPVAVRSAAEPAASNGGGKGGKGKSPSVITLAQKTVDKVDHVLATLRGPDSATADKPALAKEIMERTQSLLDGIKLEINNKSTDTNVRAQLSQAAGLLRDKSTQLKIISSVRSHRSGPDHGQVEQTAIELSKQVKELINVLIVASLKKRVAASLNQVAAVKRVFAVFQSNQS